MNCPKCNNPWACPCAACTEERGTPSNWTWHNNGMQRCGKCGFVAHEDWWTEREFEASQRAGVWPTSER